MAVLAIRLAVLDVFAATITLMFDNISSYLSLLLFSLLLPSKQQQYDNIFLLK
jgi:hypothetical protein